MGGRDKSPSLGSFTSGTLDNLTVDERWKSGFCEQFRNGKMIWISNPSNNEMKVKFLQAIFPENIQISTIDDMGQATDNNSVHIICPIVDDLNVDIYHQLRWVSEIAKKRNLKVVFTATVPILEALGPLRTVQDYDDTLLRVTNYLLDDHHLLTGNFVILADDEEKTGWKDRFIDWFGNHKPIWMVSAASNDDIVNFINRLFPDEVLRGTTDTLAEAPKDKIIIIGHIDEYAYRNKFFSTLVRVADLVKDKMMRVILTSEDLIGNVAPSNMTVVKLIELEKMMQEFPIHHEIVKAHDVE